MSSEHSEQMMALLKELAMMKESVPATPEEHLERENRRKQIHVEMGQIAADKRNAQE